MEKGGENGKKGQKNSWGREKWGKREQIDIWTKRRKEIGNNVLYTKKEGKLRE
jgi:hypothetical protein